MVQINFAQKQVNAKVVYYGPGMSGKTTNLEVIHQRAPQNNKGDLTSISTDGDRTLFFDFMPLDLGTVSGMRTCFQIYTVPGQVYYNSTRKLVLQGVDGVIFVADSSASMLEENLESLRNLEQNLSEYGRDVGDMPMVIQYNKRDLPDAMSIEDLEAALNPRGVPSFEGVANTGQGVFPTLKALAANVLDHIHQQQSNATSPTPTARPSATPAPAPETAAPAQPAESLLQTGFHPAAAAQAAPAPGTPDPTAPVQMGGDMHVGQATPAAPQQPAMAQAQQQPEMPAPASGLTLGGSMPPADAPAQPQAAPQMGQPQMSQPQMSQPQMTAPQAPAMQPAPQMQAPAMQQAPVMQQQVAAPPAPVQAAPSQAQRMQPETSPSPARQAPPSRSFPTPEKPASRKARPTPKGKGSSKSAVITTVIVIASVGLGAVLGSFILSMF